MSKKIRQKCIYIAVMALTVSLLGGCAFSVDMPEDTQRQIEEIPDTAQPPGAVSTQNSGSAPSSSAAKEATAEFPGAYSDGSTDGEYAVNSTESQGGIEGLDGYTDEEIAASGAGNVGRFAYERLTQAEKRVYNEIYMTLRDMSEEYELDLDNTDDINRLFLCVMMDHPELFWVSGYVFTRYMRGETLEAIGFKGMYTIDRETADIRQGYIDRYVSDCLAGMPATDDYGKIKYIYEYIIYNTVYDTESADNQNICSVFINGRSVCQGYAKATQYLLNKVGIPCSLVTGTATGLGNHAWNLVRADGAYYYLDTTWGDANYRTEEGMDDTVPSISYDYLCVPDREISITHHAEPPVDLPICSAIDDNYYVREGAYFTVTDDARIAALFDRAYAEGRQFVTLKASDPTVYAELKKYMLDDQNLFRYVVHDGAETVVRYWENRDLLTISFELK